MDSTKSLRPQMKTCADSVATSPNCCNAQATSAPSMRPTWSCARGAQVSRESASRLRNRGVNASHRCRVGQATLRQDGVRQPTALYALGCMHPRVALPWTKGERRQILPQSARLVVCSTRQAQNDLQPVRGLQSFRRAGPCRETRWISPSSKRSNAKLIEPGTLRR